MRRLSYGLMVLGGIGVLATLPAGAAVEISCTGAACNPFGQLDYNYILSNTGDSPVTVAEFYIATMDVDETRYSSFSSPAGFQVVIGSWAELQGYGVSPRMTTAVFTDHDVVPAASPTSSEGGVLFTGGSFTLQPGGTAAFGFNHDWGPEDFGWLVEHPDAQNFSEGDVAAPMAGPWEIYGWGPGYVHGPGMDTTPVSASTWARIKASFK